MQGSTYIFLRTAEKICPFATIYWTQQMSPAHKMYFSQLLKTNLLCETRVSQAQPVFIWWNSTIIIIEWSVKCGENGKWGKGVCLEMGIAIFYLEAATGGVL